jgi:DNA-binding XRE family transcriptional regulator
MPQAKKPRKKARPKSKAKPQPEIETEDQRLRKLRKKRAEDWVIFRRNNLFTQKRLAAVIGVSRRTVQQIEGGHVEPHPQTLRRFAVFKKKCEANADLRLEL